MVSLTAPSSKRTFGSWNPGAARPVAPLSENDNLLASARDSADYSLLTDADGDDFVSEFCKGTNAAFEKLVLPSVREWVEIRPASNFSNDIEKMVSPPQIPGIPRPVTMTILASVPTALGWYGYYKFSVEQELFYDEIERTGR